MQDNPLRVVGVAEQPLPAFRGINLSPKSTKVEPHFTATFPSQKKTSAWMTAGKPQIHCKLLGDQFSFSWESFDWNLEKYHHVEFRSKEKGGFVQSGPERRGAAAGKGSHFLHFCCLLHDHSFMNSLRGESQASLQLDLEHFNFLNSAWLQFSPPKKAEMIQTDSEQQIHEDSEFL